MEEYPSVLLPSFVNPHIFWIVDKNAKIPQVSILQSSADRQQRKEHFEIGEIVAVRRNNEFFRGVIEEVKEDDSGEQGFGKYLCWFMDKGMLFDSNVVYKLPSELKKLPALAKQACLNNLVNITQQISYDNGFPEMMETETLETNMGYHQMPYSILSQAKFFRFSTSRIVDGILLGDVFYVENGTEKSLSQTLISKRMMKINEQLFNEKILPEIGKLKDKYLMMMYHIAQQEENTVETTVFQSYLEELEEKDFESENRTRLYMSRSREDKNSSDSFKTASEANAPSDSNKCSKEALLRKLRSNKSPEADLHSETSENKSDNSNGNEKLSEEAIKAQIAKNKERRQILLQRYSNKYNDENKQPEEEGNTSSEMSEMSLKTPPGENITSKREMLLRRIRSNASSSEKSPNEVIEKPSSDSSSMIHKKNDNIAKSSTMDTPMSIQPKRLCKLPANVIFGPSDIFRSSPSTKPNRRTKPIDSNGESFKSTKQTNSIQSSSENALQNKEVQPQCGPIKPVNMEIPSSCKCKDCEHWYNQDDWKAPRPATQTVTINQQNKLTNFLQSPTEDKCHLKPTGISYNSKTEVESYTTYRLLVHSSSEVNPFKSVESAGLHDVIYSSLKDLNYNETKRMQAYCWPEISNGKNVCIINGPKTGKTLTYLPFICSFLLEKPMRYSSLPQRGGPVVVILCRSSLKCEEIYDLIKLLLNDRKLAVCLVTYPSSQINLSNVDILITLPAVLVGLLFTKAINFKRLQHFVLEDADIVLKRFPNQIKQVVGVIQDMLEQRGFGKVQLIITGEHWHKTLEDFCKILNNLPTICIGNHLEAALYGRVKFNIKFTDSACKEMDIKNLIQNRYHVVRTVVVCFENEIEEVQTMLELKGIETLALNDNTNSDDICELERSWKQHRPGQYKVLICTDFLLSTILTITSATILIHYSLAKSFTHFVKRFICLYDNISSPFSLEYEEQCESYILCDENSSDNLPKLLESLKSSDIVLPGILTEFYKKCMYEKELKKIDNKTYLCKNITMYGSCNRDSCKARHVLNKELDVEKDPLPKSGLIQFRIVAIFDVTHLGVMLLSHKDEEGVVHPYETNIRVTQDLTALFQSIKKKQVSNPSVHNLYAFYNVDEDEVFYRCEVLCIDHELVDIQLIDQGDIRKGIKKSRLFLLPKSFKVIPPQIVNVYLANFKPPFLDENFSARAFLTAKEILKPHITLETTFNADICLQLQNSIWVNNIWQESLLKTVKVIKLNYTKEINSLRLAEYDKEPMQNLTMLCNKADIKMPKIKTQTMPTPLIKIEQQAKPNWAYMEMDKPNEVIFCAGISPEEFFVRHYKFNSVFYSFSKQLQEVVLRPSYHRKITVEAGKCYLAKEPGGRDYCRVLVRKTSSSQALCFYVDYGDEATLNKDELTYLSNELITKLPFQTVLCSLKGVKSVLPEWDENALNILYNYAVEPTTDIFRSLFIQCFDKSFSENTPGQYKYEVLLKDGHGENLTLINRLLVDCGLATETEPLEDFELPCIEASENESKDEDLGLISDIIKQTETVDNNAICLKQPTFNCDDMEADLVVMDPLQFFEDLQETVDKKNTNTTTNLRELPALKAAPAVDYSTPTVLWKQQDKKILLTIKLPDVQTVDIKVTKRLFFVFKTTIRETKYQLKLALYKKVESSFQYNILGQEVRVDFTKCEEEDWPRLCLTTERLRYIQYDLGALDVEDEPKKTFLELPRYTDDEESDSDLENVLYTNCSDRDSDFEEEIIVSD